MGDSVRWDQRAGAVLPAAIQPVSLTDPHDVPHTPITLSLVALRPLAESTGYSQYWTPLLLDTRLPGFLQIGEGLPSREEFQESGADQVHLAGFGAEALHGV